MSLFTEMKGRNAILSFLLAFGLLAFFFYQADPGAIWAQVKKAGSFPIAGAFLLHYSAYLVRGFRWKEILLRLGFTGSGWSLSKITVIFQSIDCILPAKLATSTERT